MNRDQEDISLGHVVFYWKPVGRDSEGQLRTAKRYGVARKWQGPARVIGRDVHGFWLVRRGWPLLVNREQLRLATRSELQAWRWVHGEESLAEGTAQRGFEDLRGRGQRTATSPRMRKNKTKELLDLLARATFVDPLSRLPLPRRLLRRHQSLRLLPRLPALAPLSSKWILQKSLSAAQQMSESLKFLNLVKNLQSNFLCSSNRSRSRLGRDSRGG